MNPEADPDFRPGFRFSKFDAAILIGGALVTVGAGFFLAPVAGLVVAFVLGHFFLFCNVFRIARGPELGWATVFFLAATGAMLSNRPVAAWSLAFGGSFLVAVALIALETRKPSYHGIGWQRFNPGLQDWWNRVRSERKP